MIGSVEWMHDNYPIFPCEGKNSMGIKKLFMCAYRKYDKNAGGTGGPGGVQHLLQDIFGDAPIAGFQTSYIYMPEERVVPENVWRQMEGLNLKVKVILAAAGYISTAKKVEEVIQSGENPVFFCHDIGSAYGAYLLKCPYVLVYHQQGSILAEMLSAGLTVSEVEKEILTYIERKVLGGAKRVYFPSNGAREVMRESCLLDIEKWNQVCFGEFPLYNTVGRIRNRENIPIVWAQRKEHEIFVSVGDFVFDKGLDRVPEFLAEYQRISGKMVLWIAIGNFFNQRLFSEVYDKCQKYSVKAFLFTHRVEHDKLIEMVGMADYYIMLHRRAIFDLATLEAMQLGKCVILSDCISNREYNVCDNVVLVDSADMGSAVDEVLRKDKNVWRYQSRKAFREYFDVDMFARRYAEAVFELGRELQGQNFRRELSEVNKASFLGWKDRYKGGACVICGAGVSLENIREQEKDCVYIALNRALFYKPIHYDFLFMQDKLENLEDYNSYACTKFYGIINNRAINVEGLGPVGTQYRNVCGEIYRYDLNSQLFDYRSDKFEYELDRFALSDAQSVLFSALQFAVFAGFTTIKLAGVEFGKVNYGNVQNKSCYARNVVKNLIAFKTQLMKDRPDISFGFLATTNQELKGTFQMLECNRKVFVSGIYTENYRDMVVLQEQTCMDDYVFEFRHISQEEWDKNKAEEGFAFYSGNTLKTQLVIDKIREHWGEVLLITDADLIFLDKTKTDLLGRLEEYDMLFLCERSSTQERFERAPANVNIGFVAMKCNEESLKYWESVQNEVNETKGWDQEIANKILAEKRTSLKYQILPEAEYLNGGGYTSSNIDRQRICTACGAIAQRLGYSKLEFLKEAYTRYYKKTWFY